MVRVCWPHREEKEEHWLESSANEHGREKRGGGKGSLPLLLPTATGGLSFENPRGERARGREGERDRKGPLPGTNFSILTLSGEPRSLLLRSYPCPERDSAELRPDTRKFFFPTNSC